MGKYHGNLEDFKKRVEKFGLEGTWTDLTNGHKFTGDDGGVLTWFPNTGTVYCQGKADSKGKIESFIEKLPRKAEEDKVPIKTDKDIPKLFVVYGHDEGSRDQLELILGKLGIEPFILAKSNGGGLTLIEALEKQVGQNGEAHAGIALLTPDDMGYAKRAGPETIKDRARQNVILEVGMLIARLGRTHTIILVKGEVERPSDTDGIIYLSYKDHVKEVVKKLVQRLESIGFDIDHKKAFAI